MLTIIKSFRCVKLKGRGVPIKKRGKGDRPTRQDWWRKKKKKNHLEIQKKKIDVIRTGKKNDHTSRESGQNRGWEISLRDRRNSIEVNFFEGRKPEKKG